VKFIIMQFSPQSVFLHFRSKYPQTLCSQKSSVYVPPSKWETKFRTRTVQVAKLQFCIFQSLGFFFFVWDEKTRDFGLNNSNHSPNLKYSSTWTSFWLVKCRPQLFEFCHIFKRFISYPYIRVLSRVGWRDIIIYFVYSALNKKSLFAQLTMFSGILVKSHVNCSIT
jgi:hypothetical protein